MPVGEEKVRAFDSCLFLAQITTIRPAGGIVVMGGDSHSEGCGFESRRCKLDGHYIFFTLIWCNVCLKTPEINKKKAGLAQFFFNNNALPFLKWLAPKCMVTYRPNCAQKSYTSLLTQTVKLMNVKPMFRYLLPT